MKDSTYEPTKMKVMLVDDIRKNLELLKKTLDPYGYKVVLVSSGERALQIVPEFKPDLILLDIIMPGIDGFEICRRLQAEKETKDIAIIFLTAINDPENIIKGFKLGAVDYVTKPFRLEEICARVETQLQLQYSKQQLLEQNKKLKELQEIKNKFLGMVVHDLRNPLNGISGFAEMIVEEGAEIDTDEIKYCATKITASGKIMTTLIDDLLDISVIECGQLEMTIEKTSLANIIKEKIQLNHLRAFKKYNHKYAIRNDQ